ncbi:MAG: hypothetical protein ABIF82_01915 [Planctomycetota bacterium]
MRINLIPDELRPTRASPVPYMPLAGLVAISLIWVVTQFAVSSSVRGKTLGYKKELERLFVQLKAYKGLPERMTRAEGERDTLKLKAAAVTALTNTGFVCTRVLEALAAAASEELRLTSVSIDFDQGVATLKGYGSEENANIEVASFVRALNRNKAILATFRGAELNYCNSSQRGQTLIKEFAVSMRFRADRLRQMLEGGAEKANG